MSLKLILKKCNVSALKRFGNIIYRENKENQMQTFAAIDVKLVMLLVISVKLF